MFNGKAVGAALCGRPEETAGAGALSAKHEEIPLGYPRPTVNSQTNFPLSIFNSKSPPGSWLSLFRLFGQRPKIHLPLWEGCPPGILFTAGTIPHPTVGLKKLIATF